MLCTTFGCIQCQGRSFWGQTHGSTLEDPLESFHLDNTDALKATGGGIVGEQHVPVLDIPLMHRVAAEEIEVAGVNKQVGVAPAGG